MGRVERRKTPGQFPLASLDAGATRTCRGSSVEGCSGLDSGGYLCELGWAFPGWS